MDNEANDIAARAFYSESYETIVDYAFVTEPVIELRDHDPESGQVRQCRFCGMTAPNVTFLQKAHAIAELLGNKTIRSMNECDNCNKFFADEYENQLGRALKFLRAISQVKGKGGAPDYSNPDNSMRIENKGGDLAIHLVDKKLFEEASQSGGSFAFELPRDAPSFTYIPVRAAKALVKMACSICPLSELSECRRAIDWLMKRVDSQPPNFPIVRGFTPGPPAAFKSKVTLLRRKQAKEVPYLCCIIQSLNHRFQFFVPGCDLDRPFYQMQLRCYRLPEIPFNWPFGESTYHIEDWSSEIETKSSTVASFHVLKAEIIKGPDVSQIDSSDE